MRIRRDTNGLGVRVLPIAFLISPFLAFVLTAHAQSASTQKLVVVTTTVLESIQERPTMIPIRCDSEGNLYVRFYQRDFLRAPVTQIAPDGSSQATYSLTAVPQKVFSQEEYLDKGGIADFSIGPANDVYELVNAGPHAYVVQFSMDGDYEDTIELRPKSPAAFWRLAALPDGKFFASGTVTRGEGAGQPLNAIFDAQGTLIADIRLAGDISGKMMPDARKPDEEFDKAMETGAAIIGDDGDIYLMHGDSPATIFVLSPSGRLLRKLVVKAPMEGASTDTFKVLHGRLAVEFSKPQGKDRPDEIAFRIVNASTGDWIADYAGGPETSRWACYTDDGFVFLGAKDKKTTRVRAIPQ